MTSRLTGVRLKVRRQELAVLDRHGPERAKERRREAAGVNDMGRAREIKRGGRGLEDGGRGRQAERRRRAIVCHGNAEKPGLKTFRRTFSAESLQPTPSSSLFTPQQVPFPSHALPQLTSLQVSRLLPLSSSLARKPPPSLLPTHPTPPRSDDFNFYFSPRLIDHAETTEVGGFAPSRGRTRKSRSTFGACQPLFA